MQKLLQAQLADAAIRQDLELVFMDCNWTIELDGRDLPIPRGVDVEVLARSFHSYEIEIGFGDHYRVLAAIGGLKEIEHGVPWARLCFATLYYSAKGKLLTVDFSSQMP